MGEKHDEDPLTYEKLQHMIDEQLAHIDELQTENEDIELEHIISPVDDQLNKRSRLLAFCKRFKRYLISLFKHKRNQ